MKAIFLEVEYLGERYYGFQLQNKHGKQEITVQEVLEKAIKKLFGQAVRIDYTSRTDAGVHARSQGVSFDIETKIPLKNIKRALNTYLPCDIRVKRVKSFPAGWRVHEAVIAKTYRYTVCNAAEQSVFDYPFSWHVPFSIDIEAMRKAAALIKGKKDFAVFAKKAASYNCCKRHVQEITITRRRSFIYIDVKADGFLRNMVRNIVWFLIMVATGKLTLTQARDIIRYKTSYSNVPAPAKGLCLMSTEYDF